MRRAALINGLTKDEHREAVKDALRKAGVSDYIDEQAIEDHRRQALKDAIKKRDGIRASVNAIKSGRMAHVSVRRAALMTAYYAEQLNEVNRAIRELSGLAEV